LRTAISIIFSLKISLKTAVKRIIKSSQERLNNNISVNLIESKRKK